VKIDQDRIHYRIQTSPLYALVLVSCPEPCSRVGLRTTEEPSVLEKDVSGHPWILDSFLVAQVPQRHRQPGLNKAELR